LIGRPEAGGIGREAFIDKQQFVADQTKLEFRISDDDSAFRGVLATSLIDAQAEILRLLRDIAADNRAALFPIDVLIVPGFALS